MSNARIRAVVVDLDDTLYPQSSFLRGAVNAVALAAERRGLEREIFARTFDAVLASGSDSGRTLDETLERLGLAADRVRRIVPELVDAFVQYRPATLTCFPGVVESLERLSRLGPLACLTDGNPGIQRAKLDALGVTRFFVEVVVTDEMFGRSRRKPDPVGLRYIARRLGVGLDELVVIGDRPDKDVALARGVGVPVVRVQQGEYRDVPSPPGVVTVADFVAATAAVIDLFIASGTV